MVHSESDPVLGMFEASSRGHPGSQINRTGCGVVWESSVLLPRRPPSLTYLGLGVMLEPYARHVV